MADPNNPYLPRHRLVFIHPCKTGNLSQKRTIARALGKPVITDIVRAGYWEYKTWAQIAAIRSEVLVIGTVRNPFDRLLSGYLDKGVKRFEKHRLERWGFELGWNFEQFARHACKLDDAQTNQHFRSQSAEYGNLEPDILIRFETMTEDWEQVRERVRQWCGLELSALDHYNRTDHGDWRDYYNPSLATCVRFRYANDFDRWY